MRRLVLLVFLLVASPVSAASLFMTGMEMGDPRPNSGDTDLVAVAGGAIQQSIVRTGAWALQIGGGATGVLIRNTMATATLACRFYVYAESFPSDNFLYRLTTTSIGGTNLFELTLTAAGKVQVTSAGAGFSTTTGTATISSNTWTRIDAIYDKASGGVGKVYVNGSLDINTTHTGAQDNVASLWVSGTDASGGTLHHYIDDMFCQDGTAQPPDGRIIVRQGTTGTPTDNAWTKTNCTNIQDCWSNTGFTTLTNADSGLIAPAIAQTMVVAPFSSTQTGHGTEVITVGSTINGIQLAAAADASNTSNGAFRRYVNGAGPTDNAITVINTPVHGYKTPFFTDSVANLDLYEMGWNKTNTGSARRQTVYDMWMMIDYLPAPSTLRIKVTQ